MAVAETEDALLPKVTSHVQALSGASIGLGSVRFSYHEDADRDPTVLDLFSNGNGTRAGTVLLESHESGSGLCSLPPTTVWRCLSADLLGPSVSTARESNALVELFIIHNSRKNLLPNNRLSLKLAFTFIRYPRPVRLPLLTW